MLVDNPKGLLTVGQTVGAQHHGGQQEGVLEVPIDLDSRPRRRPDLDGGPGRKDGLPAPGGRAAQEGWVAVSGTDLKEGEPVIVEGGYNLPEGTPVECFSGKGRARKSRRCGGSPR